MNERDFAKGFSEIWGNHFPLLTPKFVQVFNGAYVRRIKDSSGVVAQIPLGRILTKQMPLRNLRFT
jgi:hypothetical protein